MEHIRQSSKKHASRPFDIAKDRTCFSFVTDKGAIFVFPVSKKKKKLIPVRSSMDMSHSKKYIPEISAVSSFGISPAPRRVPGAGYGRDIFAQRHPARVS